MKTTVNGISKEFNAITVDGIVDSLKGPEFKQAQIRQTIISTYPGKKVENSMSDSLFDIEAFNIEGTEYKSTRMAWVLVPNGVTKEQVEAMLATKPKARICKKYSNKLVDVLTDEQKYALSAGIVTKEQLQDKHVIKDSAGNVVQPIQYSTGFFVNDYTNHKESANANVFGDVDMRVETKVSVPTATVAASTKAVLESLA
jgi:type IV secretory pathway VirJ component